MVENNEVLGEVYAYQVNTRMPIVGLSVGTLKVPTTVKLTKEDVLICVKKAPVFRRFSASDRERDGIGNIDRLHRAEHLTKEEYEAILDKEKDNRGKVSETPVVEEKKETPVVEEPKVEEVPVVEETVPVVEEEPKVEETVVEEDSTPVVEEIPETTVEEEVNEEEEVSEEVTEETTEVENESTEENNNNGYRNKKKHRR